MSRLLRWLIRRLPGAQRRVTFYAATSSKQVALTIDDAPDAGTVDALIAVLAANGAPATFFITGAYAQATPGALAKLSEAGHDLGNHLMHDAPAWRMPIADLDADLAACDALIRRHGTPQFFRPPSGRYSRRMVRVAAARGYRTVLGDAFPFDTHIASQWVRRALLKWLIESGSIIILHDRGMRGHRSVETLRWLLPWLKDRGYAVVSLARLLASDSGAGEGNDAYGGDP